MRPKKTIVLALLVVGFGFQVVSPACDDNQECEGPGESVDESLDTLPGQLPAWAVGAFGRHEIDITNLAIEASGVAYRIFDGGDYGGGCQVLAATFSAGRVHLADGGEPFLDLVKTTAGRFFVGPANTTDMNCGWAEYQATALCGRDVGGCGGYGSTVPCTWEEVAGNRCDLGQDDGGPTD